MNVEMTSDSMASKTARIKAEAYDTLSDESVADASSAASEEEFVRRLAEIESTDTLLDSLALQE